MSGPADFKSVTGFENEPRFVGKIEQNKIQRTFFHYCIKIKFFSRQVVIHSALVLVNLLSLLERLTFIECIWS